MAPLPLTNFEIRKYQNETKFNSVYSRNSLPKIKDGAYHVINFDEYKSIETYWIALYANGNNVTYLDSFLAEYIPKEIEKFIGKKNIKKIFIEYKQMIQRCVDTFVLDSLIFCWKEKVC